MSERTNGRKNKIKALIIIAIIVCFMGYFLRVCNSWATAAQAAAADRQKLGNPREEKKKKATKLKFKNAFHIGVN